MNSQSLTDRMLDHWKDYKATDALEQFWKRTAPEERAFNEADAVAVVLTLLDCYETALRKIAAKGGTEAALADEALAYRPPAWTRV